MLKPSPMAFSAPKRGLASDGDKTSSKSTVLYRDGSRDAIIPFEQRKIAKKIDKGK